MKNKLGYISEIHYIRAIGCLFVVLVHVSGAFYYQQGSQYNEVTFFINQISRFGTPLFAMISGFLLFYHARFKGFHFRKFVSSRFTKIGLPFLFWSIFYLTFSYLILGSNPFESGEKLFLVNFIFGQSYYHLYFMAIVFQFYLLFPLLQMVRIKKIWPVLLVLAALVNYYFIKEFSAAQFEGLWQQIFSQRAFIPSWIFYFIFGGFLAYYWEALSAFAKKYKYVLGVTVLLLTVAAVWEYKTAGSIPSNRVTNMINIPIITLFIIGMGEQIQKVNWLNRFFTLIGTYSMAIYLVHPFVLYWVQTETPIEIWKTSLFPVLFAAVLFLSIAMVKLIQFLPLNQYILTVPKAKPSNKMNSPKEAQLSR